MTAHACAVTLGIDLVLLRRAQYYPEAISAAIFDQLEPVSPQSVTLGRGNGTAVCFGQCLRETPGQGWSPWLA